MGSSSEPVRPAITRESGSQGQLGSPKKARVLAGAAGKFAGGRCASSAAAMAFYSLLALLSAATAVLGLLGLVHAGPGTVHTLADAVGRALPAAASGAVRHSIGAAAGQSARSSLVALVAGVVVALWAVAGVVAALQSGLGAAFDLPADRRTLSRRLRGFPPLLGALVLCGLASALLAFGQPVGAGIQGHLRLGVTFFVVAWTVLRWIAGVALTITAVAVCYQLGPVGRRRRWLSGGALLAAAVFLAGSVGFSLCLTRLGAHGRIYGSLGDLAVGVLWLFLAAAALLAGAALNGETGSSRAPQTATAATPTDQLAIAAPPAVLPRGTTPGLPAGLTRGTTPGPPEVQLSTAEPAGLPVPPEGGQSSLAALSQAALSQAALSQAAPAAVQPPERTRDQPPPLPRRIPGQSLHTKRQT
jgi:membrane protein